jgi:phosphatidylglycerophosphate synthase
MQAIYAVYTVVISVGIMVCDEFYYFRKCLEKRMEPLLLKIPPYITPDRLSWSRVPLGITVVFFLFFYPAHAVAILFYTLAWLTDILDGALARCRKQLSVWGGLIDPVADKIMNDSIFISYAFSGSLEFSEIKMVLWMIVIADLATATAAGLMSYFINMRVEANFFGKFKFGFQCAGCMPLIFGWINLAKPILGVAAALGVMSFVIYGYSAYKELRAQRK